MSGKKQIINIKYSTKKIMCILMALLVISTTVLCDVNSLTAEAKAPTAGSGFNGLSYEDWCQKMSKYSQMQKGGCRITAYTKLLHEAGYTQFKNPDEFYKWGITKKYYTNSSVYEKAGFGDPLIAAAKHQGGTISLYKKISIGSKKKSEISNTIMSYINSGYYCILSCSAHTVYVGRAKSLAEGKPVILDSSFGSSSKWLGTYDNIIKYDQYTANTFTNLRVYKVSSPVKKNTVFKITLDPQNSSSAQYIYEKYDTGIYSNSSCTKTVSKITVPKRSGYTFNGYYTSKNGSGTKYIDASGKILLKNNSLTKATTLYASWKKNVVAKKPTITVTKAPSTIKQGNSFSLQGTISANAKISKVNAYIINASGKTVLSQSDKPNAKSFDIRKGNVNQKLYFNKLSAGTYTLKITATNSAGTTTYTKKFTVISKPKISVTQAPTSIKKGKSFGLRGTISANSKITNVTAYVIDAKGVIKQKQYDVPNNTSFDIRKGKINQKLYFGKLSKGTYTLKITATNAAGTSTYSRKFKIY